MAEQPGDPDEKKIPVDERVSHPLTRDHADDNTANKEQDEQAENDEPSNVAKANTPTAGPSDFNEQEDHVLLRLEEPTKTVALDHEPGLLQADNADMANQNRRLRTVRGKNTSYRAWKQARWEHLHPEASERSSK